MKIVGEKIILREIRESDLELLNKLINDPDINKMTVGSSKKVSMKEQIKWFKSLKSSADVRFIIANKDDIPLGTCIINQIDNNNKSCSIGIKLDKSSQGKGIGSEAIQLTIPFIFNRLKMHRIFVEILEYNAASIRLFEKNGFKLEGTHIDAIYKNGKFNNLLTLGLVNK